MAATQTATETATKKPNASYLKEKLKKTAVFWKEGSVITELARAEKAVIWYALRGRFEAVEFISSGWSFSDPAAAAAAGAIRELVEGGIEPTETAVA